MNCPYCRTVNDDEEHRCQRCGRRLHPANPCPALETYPSVSSVATATAPATASEASRPTLSPSGPPQGSFFDDREAAKVIPFRPADRDSAPAAEPKPPSRGTSRGPRRREAETELPLLDFLPPAPRAPRTLKTSVEAVIYCDAPVATPMHRLFAAVLDTGMLAMGATLFFAAYAFGGGGFVTTKIGLSVYSIAALLLALFYGFLWAVSGRETPGMRWARLRLVNFDGFHPDLGERLLRYVTCCLSLSAVGLGMLWSLVDEESLTWHDHISKTFPTQEDRQASSFRRL